MKKILPALTLLLGTLSMTSCTIEGDKTVQAINEVFEVKTDFSPNVQETFHKINPALYKTDHILVYKLWGVANNQDVWRLVPNTVYFSNNDEIKYNFDHTASDIRLFLEPNFDLNTLSSENRNKFLYNQIFRIVVIPGGVHAKADYSDYYKTLEMFGMSDAKITRLN